MMYGNGIPFDPYNGQQMQPAGVGVFQPTQNPYGYGANVPQQLNNQPKKPPVDPRTFETPQIVSGGSLFKVSDRPTSIPVDNLSDAEKVKAKNRGAGRRKVSKEDTSMIVKDTTSSETAISGEVEPAATIYSYQETNNLLHDTLGQIDAINAELVQEFNVVRHSRTMKNKYSTLNALSENIGAMISNRLTTIKEINNCISKANEMDYKKYKDIKAAQASITDDKYITDVYKALMQNQAAQPTQLQMPQMTDPSILGSGIVRANITSADATGMNPIDAQYLGYIANLTPEQNLMRYESDPNVKQVVVYDASTGAKFFQYMNMATGEAIPNLPVYDDNIMQDTTLDIKQGIAKNINLNQTFPIVTINDNITSQY